MHTEQIHSSTKVLTLLNVDDYKDIFHFGHCIKLSVCFFVQLFV